MNNKIRFAILSAVAALGAVSAASVNATTNSAERVAAIAKLPDWSGIWRVNGSNAYLSGNKNNLPPYNTAWQAKLKAAQKDKGVDTADHFCAIAVPRLLSSSQPFEVFVTPEETLMYYGSREVRHIWTDGRDHPPEDERWPMYWAESKGRWQGQTLIVETINIHGNLWIDPTGATLSDDATLVERISMVDKNHLQSEITITDPTALTKPWSFKRTYERQVEKELTEQGCVWRAGQAGQ
ncbi:MAG: hypothetical protein QM808_08475 [Steroidobacteraceae bacterium]